MPDTRRVAVVSEYMLEARLEAFFRHRVRLAGGMTFKMAPTEVGMPDRLVIFPHRMYLVELKTTRGSLSAAQIALHKRLENLGIYVHVLYGQDQVVNWIARRVDERGPRE